MFVDVYSDHLLVASCGMGCHGWRFGSNMSTSSRDVHARLESAKALGKASAHHRCVLARSRITPMMQGHVVAQTFMAVWMRWGSWYCNIWYCNICNAKNSLTYIITVIYCKCIWYNSGICWSLGFLNLEFLGLQASIPYLSGANAGKPSFKMFQTIVSSCF